MPISKKSRTQCEDETKIYKYSDKENVMFTYILLQTDRI